MSKTLHEALKPLSWITGKWKSVSANGFYPTIKPFTYCEEITFTCKGQPLLNYDSYSWNPEKNIPMHLESGFLRINPGTNEVSFMLAHNFGVTTLEEGVVEEKCLHIKSQCNQINRMSFSKEPYVVGTERSYILKGDDELHYTFRMETTKTPLTDHLNVVYKKVL